jgi:predicted amino acid-binding ACT domain protein
VTIGTLRKELEEYSQRTELTLMMQHNDIFRVTNEVPLH